MSYDDISKYGVPKKYTACPGCGRQYGHHNTKICIECQECSKCCFCESPELKSLEDEIQNILGSM